MTVACPDCRSVFRVDPAKVPATGVRARCSVCGGVIVIAAGTLPVAVTPSSTAVVSSPIQHSGQQGAPFPARATGTPQRPYTPQAPVAAAAPRGASSMTPAMPTGVLGAGSQAPGGRQGVPAASPSVTAQGAAAPRAPAPAPNAVAPRLAGTQPVGIPAIPGVMRSPAAGSPAAGSSAAPSPGAFPARATPAAPPVRPPAATPSAASAPASPPMGANALGTPASARRPINPFLNADPGQRARRLARALVSDLVAYHPQKREEGLRNGTLRQLFREEIKKSYEEYVEQVGRELADGSPHFQDALNEILGGGRKLF